MRPPLCRVAGSAISLEQRRAPGRRGDDRARIGAEPKAELEVVPALLRARPFGELVGPREMVLGPAQPSRGGARKQQRQAIARQLELARARPPHEFLVKPRTGEDSAFALDHHLGRFLDRPADQRDARAWVRPRLGQHPFRARARLPEAAASHDQPGPPFAAGLPLSRQRLRWPVFGERPAIGRAEAVDDVPLHVRRAAGEPADEHAERLVLGQLSAPPGLSTLSVNQIGSYLSIKELAHRRSQRGKAASRLRESARIHGMPAERGEPLGKTEWWRGQQRLRRRIAVFTAPPFTSWQHPRATPSPSHDD